MSETRVTPAGLPIRRIRLEHNSRQREAELELDVACSVIVVVIGEPLNRILQSVKEGDGVRVSGFLAQAGYRQEHQLELHAKRLEYIDLSITEVSKEND